MIGYLERQSCMANTNFLHFLLASKLWRIHDMHITDLDAKKEYAKSFLQHQWGIQ